MVLTSEDFYRVTPQNGALEAKLEGFSILQRGLFLGLPASSSCGAVRMTSGTIRKEFRVGPLESSRVELLMSMGSSHGHNLT